MAGDRLAFLGRYFGDLLLHPGIELGQPLVVEFRALAIAGCIRGIGFGEALGDVRDIDADTAHILPAVRIGTVGVAMARRRRRFERRDADCCDDGPSLEGSCLGQPVDPALETQAVAHQNAGFGEGARIGGTGLVGVSVDIGADERGYLGEVSRHFGHEVVQDREGRDGLEFGLRRGRQASGQEEA